MALQFSLENCSGLARAGSLTLGNVTVPTPMFMPVGTVGSVKAMDPARLQEMGYDLILGNTYHLHLRPTSERVKNLGGLHKMMAWPGAILTDSGGYQAFSLKESKISDDGVKFKSHIDGSPHFFSPEKSLEIQRNLGSNIVMVLDHCLGHGKTHAETIKAMNRTHLWAKRSRAFELESHQNLFGIVQGGFFDDLRKESADFLSSLEVNGKQFEGLALGGLAVGESQELLHESVKKYAPLLPENRPRYLMGVGYPEDLLEAIDAGIDMFDCVLPTRNARNGQAFTKFGVVSIKQQRYIDADEPLDSSCECSTCSRFSKAYLRHLYVSGEILSSILLTHHNLFFYRSLVRQARQAILENTFASFKAKMLQSLASCEADAKRVNTPNSSL